MSIIFNPFNTGQTVSDEDAQDAVGGIVLDTPSLNLTYDDAAPSIYGDVLQAPSVVRIFTTDAGTVSGDLVTINGSNTVTAITSNSSATIPHGIFGVVISKPTSLTAEILFLGGLNGYSGLTIGSAVFISLTGTPTHAVPATGMIQQIGFAISATEIFFNFKAPLRRA